MFQTVRTFGEFGLQAVLRAVQQKRDGQSASVQGFQIKNSCDGVSQPMHGFVIGASGLVIGRKRRVLAA
jgi:hypothetical protein